MKNNFRAGIREPDRGGKRVDGRAPQQLQTALPRAGSERCPYRNIYLPKKLRMEV